MTRAAGIAAVVRPLHRTRRSVLGDHQRRGEQDEWNPHPAFHGSPFGARDCTVVACKDRMEHGLRRYRQKQWRRKASGSAVLPSMATMSIGSNGGRMKADAVCSCVVARTD